MEIADLEILRHVERGDYVFRRLDTNPAATTAFQLTVERLLRLRSLGLILFFDSQLIHDARGCVSAGPCSLTFEGDAMLAASRGSSNPTSPSPVRPRVAGEWRSKRN